MYCIYSIVYVLFHTDVERLRCLYVSSACFYRTVYAASPSLVDCGCCPSQVVSRALPGIPTNSGLFKQWASSGCQSLVTIMVSSIYIYICIYNIYAQQIDTVKKEIKREKFWVSYIFSGLVMSCRSFVSFAGHNDTPIAPRRL